MVNGHFSVNSEQNPGQHYARAIALLGEAQRATGTDRAIFLAEAGVHMLAAALLQLGNPVPPDTSLVDNGAPPSRHPAKVRAFHNPAWVRVFHNTDITAISCGYRRTHRLVEVYAYSDPDVTAATTDADIATRAYQMFNTTEAAAFEQLPPQAQDYHARRNRTLAPGDVVAVDNRFYTGGTGGWHPINEPTLVRATTTLIPGTVPFY